MNFILQNFEWSQNNKNDSYSILSSLPHELSHNDTTTTMIKIKHFSNKFTPILHQDWPKAPNIILLTFPFRTYHWKVQKITISIALFIRELEIRTTERHHLTSTRIARIRKTEKQGIGEDIEKLEASCADGGNAKWCSHWGKHVSSSSQS